MKRKTRYNNKNTFFTSNVHVDRTKKKIPHIYACFASYNDKGNSSNKTIYIKTSSSHVLLGNAPAGLGILSSFFFRCFFLSFIGKFLYCDYTILLFLERNARTLADRSNDGVWLFYIKIFIFRKREFSLIMSLHQTKLCFQRMPTLPKLKKTDHALSLK